ncbi:RNA methyltransferase [Oxalobacteraceae bacterium OM1]|nr:RNA methyltransferase [Oxalobacteraceae bacterium OM1]
MQIDTLRQRLRAHGAQPVHEQRILRDWLQARSHERGRRPASLFFPKPLATALPALDAEFAAIARVMSAHETPDGSARLLVGLADGQMVESVLLPRDGVCISSQVGCAVACRFCMTGKSGLLRQLTSGEMLAQVALARQRRKVKKVVFMGMGEPAHNLQNVLDAIELLGTEGNIGHKSLVFSTVGDPRVFERLPQAAVKPALALSLHTTKAELRAQLLPNAPRLTPQDLVALGEDYARATAYPIQYQWTLLEGVNDGDDEIDGIVELLKGKYAVLNLIPYNTVPELAYRRPADERSREMIRLLHRRGILAKLRDSAAQEVDGGCGQLRARALGGAARRIPIAAEG